MDNASTPNTGEVEGYTPFAMIPRWIARSGSNLSHGAKSLYMAMMTYANNGTFEAFPNRETLANDIGSNIRSVTRFIKELEAFGALRVERKRRNKKTGGYYSNHYVLVFNNPCADSGARPPAKSGTLTRPTKTFNIDPPLVTSSNKFDDQKKNLARSTKGRTRPNPGNLTTEQRTELRNKLVTIGKLLQDGYKFYSEKTQDEWWTFIGMMEEAFKDDFDNTSMADLLHNQKWTVSAKVADPYEAGKELNKIINTCFQ